MRALCETALGILAIVAFIGFANVSLEVAQGLWGVDITAWVFG